MGSRFRAFSPWVHGSELDSLAINAAARVHANNSPFRNRRAGYESRPDFPTRLRRGCLSVDRDWWLVSPPLLFYDSFAGKRVRWLFLKFMLIESGFLVGWLTSHWSCWQGSSVQFVILDQVHPRDVVFWVNLWLETEEEEFIYIERGFWVLLHSESIERVKLCFMQTGVIDLGMGRALILWF